MPIWAWSVVLTVNSHQGKGNFLSFRKLKCMWIRQHVVAAEMHPAIRMCLLLKVRRTHQNCHCWKPEWRSVKQVLIKPPVSPGTSDASNFIKEHHRWLLLPWSAVLFSNFLNYFPSILHLSIWDVAQLTASVSRPLFLSLQRISGWGSIGSNLFWEKLVC